LTVPEPPSAEDVGRALRLLAPIRKLINPKVYGIDNVPQQRALLVGNHTVMGMLDSPLMCAELWEHGIIVRSLGDHAHFKIPVWRDVLTACGVVDGTRAITSELMRRGEVILVYPGGGREVAKRKGERYKLIWKERMGFARLAIEHGYTIVPFAAVGAEEAVDIVLDGDNPLLAPTRLFAEKVLGSKDAMPITRGIGLTPVPRPERQYYWFGEPISTERRRPRGAGRDQEGRRGRDGVPARRKGRRPQSFCAETASRTGAALNPCASPYRVATRWASRPSSTTGLPATQAIFARKSHTGR
jgi:1-acyl-sn-glycerol-3-phosphate acyltransferase